MIYRNRKKYEDASKLSKNMLPLDNDERAELKALRTENTRYLLAMGEVLAEVGTSTKANKILTAALNPKEQPQ